MPTEDTQTQDQKDSMDLTKSPTKNDVLEKKIAPLSLLQNIKLSFVEELHRIGGTFVHIEELPSEELKKAEMYIGKAIKSVMDHFKKQA